MNHWLWLLTNQLYRPTPKSLTPALRFGFAVDSGDCAVEKVSATRISAAKAPDFRSIPKECHSGQAGASTEGPILDAGDAVTNRNARQAGAPNEGGNPDACELTVFPESDAPQAATITEGLSVEAGNAVRNRDAPQVVATKESTPPDTGDAVRNRNSR